MALLRSLKEAKVSEQQLRRAYVRMGVALMQLDRILGPVVLNGRDLIHIPPYATFKTTIKTLRMLDSETLHKTLYQLDMIEKFMSILVQGWRLVPKTMVGVTGRTGKYNGEAPG